MYITQSACQARVDPSSGIITQSRRLTPSHQRDNECGTVGAEFSTERLLALTVLLADL